MRISDLNKLYKTKYETVSALRGINLYLPKTGMVFIVGVSGSGKSTLMNMLSGIDRPSNGNIYIAGEPLFKDDEKQLFGYRNSYVGMIFQDYNLIDDLNVYDNIKLILDLMDNKNYDIIDEVIKQVDIEDIKFSKVNEISSGQMQRVAIARTLVKNSSIILADEPTGNLDTKNEKIVFDILKEISKERLVVVITHDDDAAHTYSDRIIRIEDGNITEDTNPLKVDESVSVPNFIEPKLTFKQQARFTKGFIKNNFGRALSIFLLLLLIPIIGGILASYAFFDISYSYKQHQDKYNSNYIMISKKYNDTNIYFNADDLARINTEYENSLMLEQYDSRININTSGVNISDFYRPEISSIIIFNYALDFEGEVPYESDEILVTDYVMEAMKHYQNKNDINTLEIDGLTYKIVGVVNTDYEYFISADMENEYTRMAFEENLNFYNSIFVSFNGHSNIVNNMTSYHEQISFLVRSSGPTPVAKYANVLVTKEGGQSLIAGRMHGKGEAIVSSAFFTDVMGLGLNRIDDYQRYIFYTHTKARYSISPYLTGVFDSDEYIIVVNQSDFDEYKNKLYYGRIIISKDDVNYDEIVKNENVTNVSFVYANHMWSQVKEAKIVMYEFLAVLILIISTFAITINTLTIGIEKRKIGIKYSFGIRKIQIIIPYIIENLLYIIISFISSIIVVKYLFPFVMKNVILYDLLDKKAFDFFYISWSTIIGWDLLIYSIMIGSLIWMILKILVKSPIEIIKDL